MIRNQSVLPVCLGVLCVLAPAWRTPACAQPGGIEPEWEVRKHLTALVEHTKKLDPLLDQIKPQDWVSQGAPEAYVTQLKSTRAQLQSLRYSTEALIREPSKLTAALDALFRIESLDIMLRSLAGGLRKYQNAAVADLLQGALADGAGSRETLRRYILDLAAEREQAFKVIDEEAQRCRSVLSRQPQPRKGTPAKKEEPR
jgi:hypothetical protein